MTRKKLSEMTPIERVDQRMKGMTWEEAEDVGVEILARCMSLHIHVRKDGDKIIQCKLGLTEPMDFNVVKTLSDTERGAGWNRSTRK